MHRHMKGKCKACLATFLLTFTVNVEFKLGGGFKRRIVNIRGGKLERLTNENWKELKRDSRVSGDRLRTDKTALAAAELPKVGFRDRP